MILSIITTFCQILIRTCNAYFIFSHLHDFLRAKLNSWFIFETGLKIKSFIATFFLFCVPIFLVKFENSFCFQHCILNEI